MWHEWIYKEIGQARLMLNDLESCQHIFEVRKIYYNLKHSLKLVQNGVWEMGERLHEARMQSLRHQPKRPSMREQPTTDYLSGWRVLLAEDEQALLGADFPQTGRIGLPGHRRRKRLPGLELFQAQSTML